MDVRYPDITVRLTGEDGNAFNILGIVDAALEAGGVGIGDRQIFYDEATNGDYDNLLRTCMRWVNVI